MTIGYTVRFNETEKDTLDLAIGVISKLLNEMERLSLQEIITKYDDTYSFDFLSETGDLLVELLQGVTLE